MIHGGCTNFNDTGTYDSSISNSDLDRLKSEYIEPAVWSWIYTIILLPDTKQWQNLSSLTGENSFRLETKLIYFTTQTCILLTFSYEAFGNYQNVFSVFHSFHWYPMSSATYSLSSADTFHLDQSKSFVFGNLTHYFGHDQIESICRRQLKCC